MVIAITTVSMVAIATTSVRAEEKRTHSAPERIGLGWDIAIEFGYSPSFMQFPIKVGSGNSGAYDRASPWLGRVRGGGLYATHDWALQLGVIGELGGLASFGYGIQTDLIHIRSGLWGELGFTRARPLAEDSGGGWVGSIATGWNLLGIEFQHRWDPTEDNNAIFLKVRVPIGFDYFFLHE